MPVDLPPVSHVYQDQMTTLSHGLALWNPNPPKEIYDKVSIGDVGYLHEGSFIRMFNVMLAWNHDSNRTLGEPEPYESLDCGPFANTIKRQFDTVKHCSCYVSTETTAGNLQAMTTDDVEGVTYKFQKRGALLSLPNGGYHEDVIRAQAFEDYVQHHVDSWFTWAQKNRLGVGRVEDLILVSGRTLVTSWAVAAFLDDTMDAEISLASRTLNNGGASFVWSNIRGRVFYHNSRLDPKSAMTQDQCVFIRGFRIKDDKMQVIRALGVPEYDDPNIVGVVDTIRPPVKNENPQRFSYRHPTLQRNDWGSSSSLDTIRLPINHENPQLLPYSSSTTLQSNGSVYNASFMTSPSHDSFFEVRNYIVEIHSEDVFDEDTTNITHDNGLQLVDNVVLESLTVNAEDSLPENNTLFNWNSYHQPFNVYREQLSSLYLGLALWNPNPVKGLFKDPDHVSIADVGYLDNGAFMRIFNAKLPRDHPSNQSIELPVEYKPLKRERFNNVRRIEVRQEEYHSHSCKVDNVRANTHDEDLGQTYEYWAQGHGALLCLPHGAHSEDVIRTKLFEDYIRDNVDSWLRWSKKNGLPVKKTEDLILVTGCTLAKSWAAAVFDGTMSRYSYATAVSLEARKLDGGGAQFIWRNNRGSVEYHHSDSNIEGPENQCVFIRGFRAKSRFFRTKHLRAA